VLVLVVKSHVDIHIYHLYMFHCRIFLSQAFCLHDNYLNIKSKSKENFFFLFFFLYKKKPTWTQTCAVNTIRIRTKIRRQEKKKQWTYFFTFAQNGSSIFIEREKKRGEESNRETMHCDRRKKTSKRLYIWLSLIWLPNEHAWIISLFEFIYIEIINDYDENILKYILEFSFKEKHMMILTLYLF
jgi:hypothetical protein